MCRAFLPLLLAATLIVPLAVHAISFSLPTSPPNAVPHLGAGMSDAGFSVPATISFNGTI